MITNILLSSLFACSVLTSAPINNYHNQKQNAINENAFVLDDNNYFVTDENVFYCYTALINQPTPNGMEELIDALYMIPRPPAGKSLIEFKTNSNNLSAYVGRWYNITKYFDDDNNANYYILLQKEDQSYTSVDAYTLLYEDNLRPSQWYAIRFYENIDYDTHKDNFNGMCDRNGEALYRQFKPIIELGSVLPTVSYEINNAFSINYNNVSNNGSHFGSFDGLLLDNERLIFLDETLSETYTFNYYNFLYEDSDNFNTQYYPDYDYDYYINYEKVSYKSIGSRHFNFFENYVFLKPNEKYIKDLILDIEYLFNVLNIGIELEYDIPNFNYICDGVKYDYINIYFYPYVSGGIDYITFDVLFRNNNSRIERQALHYSGINDWDSLVSSANAYNYDLKYLLEINTVLDMDSFNVIKLLIIPSYDETTTEIGIFNIFDLLSGGLLGIGAILSVMVLPGITIGMLLFLPFLALILFFIISLFKR